MTYRLIAKDRDYYDAMFHAYGFDPKKVWKRKEKEIQLTTENGEGAILVEKLQKTSGRKYIPSYLEGFIGVGGVLYPYRLFLGDDPLYPSHNNKRFKITEDNDRLSDFFEKASVTKNADIALDYPFQLVDSPILRMYFRGRNVIIEGNPNLRAWNFQEVLSPFDVFTGVERCLESILMTPETPSTTPNDCRIVSAGFDMKQSFRHRKDD